ncbi:MAG: DoxX family protein [Gemmatimonadota bacterium]
MTLSSLRNTSDDKLVAGVRIFLAVMFLMTGAMKLLVPVLAEAWAGQLLAAGIPLRELSRLTVPYLELALGALLAVGAFVRPAAATVIGIMAVATYVHLVVDDPSLFPLQPSEPIIPLIVIALSLVVLRRGAGARSLDLNATRRSS